MMDGENIMVSISSYLAQNSNKVGIDLDSVSEFKLLKSYFNAKNMFPGKKIRLYISSGGEGYHIEIYGVKSNLTIRRCLGDCADRMSYSELRSKNKDNVESFVYGEPQADDVLFAIKSKLSMRRMNGKIKDVIKRQNRIEIDEGNLLAKRFW